MRAFSLIPLPSQARRQNNVIIVIVYAIIHALFNFDHTYMYVDNMEASMLEGGGRGGGGGSEQVVAVRYERRYSSSALVQESHSDHNQGEVRLSKEGETEQLDVASPG